MILSDKKGMNYTVEGEVIIYGMVPVDGDMIIIETLSKYNWMVKKVMVAEFLVPK
jgi:hypothetical protein